jgi:hypothetical protein
MIAALVTRELYVTTRRPDAAAHVAEKHDRPIEKLRMMAIAGVAEVNDDGVVEHRAVPFANGVEPARQVGDESGVQSTDLDEALLVGSAAVGGAVTDAVNIEDAEPRKRPEGLAAAARGESDDIGQARDQGGGRDLELGFEKVALKVIGGCEKPSHAIHEFMYKHFDARVPMALGTADVPANVPTTINDIRHVLSGWEPTPLANGIAKTIVYYRRAEGKA